MPYILGLVGHPDVNEEVKDIIMGHFENIEVFEIGVVDDTDLELIRLKIRSYEKKCMGILFTAKDLCHLFYSKMQVKAHSSYLENDKSELLKTLFMVNSRDMADCSNISIDSVCYDEIKNLYTELGFTDEDRCQILTIPFKLSEVNSIHKITSVHKENHYRFGCTCITYFTETKNKLEKLKIPVFKVGINKEEVIKKVNEFIVRRYNPSDRNKNRVAVVIKIGELKEYLVLNNSEHNVVAEYNRISEAVFWFAERIDGAYIPNDQRKYIIFCDKENYEKETNSSINIQILDEISSRDYFICYIGVGYGLSDREAIKNATVAQIKSSKLRKSSAYIMYGKNEVLGPVLPLTDQKNSRKTIYDVMLNEIALKSQISINTVYKLYNIVTKSGDSDFTSRDISDYLGITVRSTNRLFSKLIKSGYVKMIGERSSGERGRPSRIFRFLF